MGYAFMAVGAVLVLLAARALGPIQDEPTHEQHLRDYEAGHRDATHGANERSQA